MPNDEEAKVLLAKGISFEESLADEATYTVGFPVLAPVFEPEELKSVGAEGLFATALCQLLALEPFREMSYGARTKGFISPTYDGKAKAATASLETLRDEAFTYLKPESHDTLRRLYAFYSALKKETFPTAAPSSGRSSSGR